MPGLLSFKFLYQAPGSCLAAAILLSVPAESAVSPSDVRTENGSWQRIGAVEINTSGNTVLYEWSRPINWSPPAKTIPAAILKRGKTSLYWTKMRDAPLISGIAIDSIAPSSFYLVVPGPASTYWLGASSPDGTWASFYELDLDSAEIRAGAAKMDPFISPINPPRIIWFDAPPKLGPSMERPSWSDDGKYVIYQTRAGIVRGDITTGRTSACGDCVAQTAAPTLALEEKGTSPRVNGEALASRSRDGELEVYVVDEPHKLGMYAKYKGRRTTLFENKR